MKFSFCDSVHGPLLIAIDRDGLRYVEFVLGEQPVTRPTSGSATIRRWPPSSNSSLPTSPVACAASICRSPPGAPLSAIGLARPGRHPLRRDRQLPRDCPGHRQSQGGSCCGRRQWAQSAQHHSALSPGDRPQRRADRLCRRHSHQTLVAGAGTADCQSLCADSLTNQRHPVNNTGQTPAPQPH